MTSPAWPSPCDAEAVRYLPGVDVCAANSREIARDLRGPVRRLSFVVLRSGRAGRLPVSRKGHHRQGTAGAAQRTNPAPPVVRGAGIRACRRRRPPSGATRLQMRRPLPSLASFTNGDRQGCLSYRRQRQTTTTNDSPARAPGPQRPRLFAGRGPSVVVGAGTCVPPVVRRCLVRSPTATGRDACPTNDNDKRQRQTTTTNDDDQRLPGEGAGATTTTAVCRAPTLRCCRGGDLCPACRSTLPRPFTNGDRQGCLSYKRQRQTTTTNDDDQPGRCVAQR
jgi:hypothetical protein